MIKYYQIMKERLSPCKTALPLMFLLSIILLLFLVEHFKYKDLAKMKISSKTVYITPELYSRKNPPYTSSWSLLRRPIGVLKTFRYDDERPVIDTRELTTPADILWIDKNLTIVDIKTQVQPCETTPCSRVASSEKVKHLLFLPKNWTRKNNIQTGTVVSIKRGD
jgi:hypothetical protein